MWKFRHQNKSKEGSNSSFAKSELDQLVRLAKKYMWSNLDAQRYIEKHGVALEPSRFYSQLPSLEEIENSFEYSERYGEYGPFFDPEIFDLGTIRDFLDDVACFSAEFDPPVDGNVDWPDNYFWSNPAFSYSDAMSYWCVIRQLRPERVVEIGSGFSTLIALEALRKNGHGELICIEPFPKDWLAARSTEFKLIDSRIQDIDYEYFNSLISENSIIFIDSTHTVKVGSDCIYIYLKLLPYLTNDVVVHVHDISLPFGVNKKQAMEKHIHWAEQYLLMAYFLGNQRIKVFFSSHASAVLLRSESEAFMGGKAKPGGGSIWFRQAAAAGPRLR